MAYKVHYYAVAGRAEATRLCLQLGKLPWEDVNYTGATWPEFKPKTPFGQLPLLELPDGSMLCQSGAMARYAAKLGGLYPSDPLDAARADEAVFCTNDILELFIKTYYMTDNDEKIKARQELLAGKAKDQLTLLSKMVEERGGKFLAGGKLSYADVELFVFLSSMSSGQMDGIPKDFLKDYPVLKTFRNHIASLPEVKEYYAKHTEGAYTAFQPDA